MYRQRPVDANNCAVIQLIALVPATDQSGVVELKTQGWTLLPIFHTHGYIRHGKFQLPLFDGFPTMEAIDNLWVDNEWELEEAILSKSIKMSPKFGSIFVRLCDTRRQSELSVDSKNIDQEYLSEYLSKFKSASSSFSFRQSSILSLKDKKQDEEDFVRLAYSAFVDATNIPFCP